MPHVVGTAGTLATALSLRQFPCFDASLELFIAGLPALFPTGREIALGYRGSCARGLKSGIGGC